MVEEKKVKEVYQLVEYPTETALGIKAPTGEVITNNQAIVEILNKLDIILTKF